MSDSSEMRELVMRRYGLALAISQEVEALHVALIQSVRDGMGSLAALQSLDEHVQSVGGAVNNWKANYAGRPGHWWAWYLPEKKARKSTYAAGLWVFADDVDGRLALAIQSQMNAKIAGLSGVSFREGVTKLPPGDCSEWVSSGWIVQRASVGPGVITGEQLAATATATAVPHLEFLRTLYDEVRTATE